LLGRAIIASTGDFFFAMSILVDDLEAGQRLVVINDTP
jgi:hypothetical protein